MQVRTTETVRQNRIDHRHIVSVMITIGFIACGIFIFPNAICRLVESLRDLALSCVYYVSRLFLLDFEITVTVNNLPSWQIAPSQFQPLDLFPFTWEEFQVDLKAYGERLLDKQSLQSYLRFLSDLLFNASRFLVFAIPLWLALRYAFRSYLNKCNQDCGKESLFLRFFKRVSDFTYHPVKRWIKEYIGFLRDHSFYVNIWLKLWLFYFNVWTIVLEFLAYYLYFVFSFDLLNIYRFVYKVLLDLTPALRFIPVVVWVIGAIGFMEYQAHQVGYNELNHRERKNRGFWNERGIVTAIYGNMGKGKTEEMVDAGLSAEVELRDRAFDVIVECDFCFPYFPWAKLERELKIAYAFHVCYDLSSIRRWVRKKYRRWHRDQCREKIFGYDFERYGLYHNDQLKIESVWQCLEDYACAYFVYAIECSLILSNFSVRSDVDKIDFGNFPKWNTDFFRRNPWLMPAYSRRSHILDFDILRFGKRVLKNNPNRHALGFGVYLITEIDKERKNQLENKELDKNSEKANQKNDLFNPLLRMIRHACMIRNRVFIILLCDLQRPEDWGAGGREVGELLEIVGQSDVRPVLPFWAPFWIFEAIFLWVFKPFVDLYYDYRAMRGDTTVFSHTSHGAVAKFKDWYDGVYNIFGSIRVAVDVQSGRMEGKKERKYTYKNIKKTRSERYGSDCLSGMFETYAADNTVGLADLDEFADKMATQEELRKMHSYMQDEIYDHQMAA